MMEKLYIIIPAYNEEKSIEKVIRDWYPWVEKQSNMSRLLVINDGSRDNTEEIIKKLETEMPLLQVITRQNSGHGSSIYYGYNYAIQKGADWIFQTDSDGQTNPEEFGDFWDKRDAYQVLIGHRHNRRDGISRKAIGGTVKIIVSAIFHIRIKDTNTPYRLMRADVLGTALNFVPEDYFLTNVALTGIFGRLEKNGRCKMIFLPISFRERTAGKNSINILKIIGIGTKALGELKKIEKQMKQSGL